MTFDALKAFAWLAGLLALVCIAAFLFYVSPLAILSIVVVVTGMALMFFLGMEAGRGRLRQIRVVPTARVQKQNLDVDAA